jgi:hypothetical protein
LPKWLEEKILHFYWERNCKKYILPNGTKILRSERNPVLDAYPDILRNELESGEIVPCEIEWATSNFFDHKHDINVLQESNGFLVTFIQNTAFPVPQIKIDENDFIEWFNKDAKIIAKDTLDTIRKRTKKRTECFVWLIYLGGRNLKDSEIAFNNGVWGFPKSNKGNRRGFNRISEIKADDIIIFVKKFTFNEENKLVTPWNKDSSKFIGQLNEVIAYRVIKGFYESGSNFPWNSDNYQFRIDLDKEPIFKGKNIPYSPKTLGEYLHLQIVSQINKRSIEHINSTYFLHLLNLCAKYN